MKIFCSQRDKSLRFLAISVIVTMIDYLVFFSLYHRSGIFTAHALSYVTAILVSFTLQKKYVFQKKRPTIVAFSGVLIFSLVGIFLGYAALYAYNWVIGNIVIAKILMTGTMFLYNFHSKKFAFGDNS